jgi:predicted PurR-regulated permease PerM
MASYRTEVPDTRRVMGDDDPPEVIRAELDWRTVAWFLAAFVALVALTGLVRAAGGPLTWIGVGTLLALALDPLVSRLQARVGRRSIAVAVVLAGFIATLVALLAVFGPPAARQARNLRDDLPAAVADLEDLPVIGSSIEQANASDNVQDFLDELPDRLAGDTAPIENVGRSVLGGALAGIASILAAVTLLLDGSQLLARLRRIVPARHRATADRVGSLAYRTVGQYFAGSVLVAAIAGVSVTAVGLALGVPLAPLLGAWVAIFDLVPQIGGAVGGLPFVLFGLTQGAGTGVACLVFFVVYLNFENHVLQPIIVGRTVRLSPPATMTAALVGVSAAGVVGALVAVPLLGTAKAIYLELRSRQPVDPDAGAATAGRPESGH